MHPSQFVVCVFLLIVSACLSQRLSCASSPFSVGVRSPRRCASPHGLSLRVRPSLCTARASISLFTLCVLTGILSTSITCQSASVLLCQSVCVLLSQCVRQCVFFFISVRVFFFVSVRPSFRSHSAGAAFLSLSPCVPLLIDAVHNSSLCLYAWASFPFLGSPS